jgi:1-acyl-sn-glycerol-3-phosphate acyltransferase
MAVVRSVLFALLQALITVPYSFLSLATFPLSAHSRYKVISFWARLVVWLARLVCGIRWQVLGREHLPPGPAVVLAKHQSAWETMALQLFFPPLSLVVKKDLLRIPFFGWGLRMLNPIAIDRQKGREALKQIEEQGLEKLRQGFWVLVFPEGTRVKPGERRRYGIGGTWLAAKAGVPVVPVAHNAGRLWGRNAFFKRPGLVTVSIGPALESTGLTASELIRRVESWIEGEMERLETLKAQA